MMLGPLSEWFIQNQRVDLVFYLVLLFAIIAFLFGEGFWFTRKLRAKQVEKVYHRHLEVAWSLIPLLVLVSLTFVHYKPLTSTPKVRSVGVPTYNGPNFIGPTAQPASFSNTTSNTTLKLR